VTYAEWIVVGEVLEYRKYKTRVRVIRSIVGTWKPGEIVEAPGYCGNKNEHVIAFGPKNLWSNGYSVELEDEIRFLATHAVGRYGGKALFPCIPEDSFSSRREALRWVGAVDPNCSFAATKYLAERYDGRWLAQILIGMGALLAIGILAWRRRFSLRTLLVCVLLIAALGMLPQVIFGPPTASVLAEQLREARQRFHTGVKFDGTQCRMRNLLGATFGLAKPLAEQFLRDSVTTVLDQTPNEPISDDSRWYLKFCLDEAASGGEGLYDELTGHVCRALYEMRGQKAWAVAYAVGLHARNLKLRWTDMADPAAVADGILAGGSEAVIAGYSTGDGQHELYSLVEELERVGRTQAAVKQKVDDFIASARKDHFLSEMFPQRYGVRSRPVATATADASLTHVTRLNAFTMVWACRYATLPHLVRTRQIAPLP